MTVEEFQFGSVCSGIEAASVAWKPLGWRAAWFSEIERFPCAVLDHHHPDVPNLGDMTEITNAQIKRHAIDLLVGGTPCQSFSVAGLRKGLADPRGNLALEFLRLADAARPRWLVWENVPGVLSSNGGRDFGAFLGGLVKLGYGWAYRIMDAQYIRVESHPWAVPQRRRRVFVVAHLGDWRRAAAVLFERQSMSGDSPPSREAGPGVAALTSSGVGTCGADDNQAQAGHLIAGTVQASYADKWGLDNQHIDAGCPIFVMDSPIAFDSKATDCQPGQISPTMRSMNHDKSHANAGGQVAVAFDLAQITSNVNRTRVSPELPASTLSSASRMHMAAGMSVRRLTPRECERLQGFPDDYTLIEYRGKPAPDGPRYKAIGNSMAIPPMRWIGERIRLNEHQAA